MRTTWLWIAACALGCGNEPGTRASDAGAPADVSFDSGKPPFSVTVPAKGRTYVSLAGPSVVGSTDAWDLAFEGWDVFTNGGASGSGSGAAFGPHDLLACGADVLDAPILRKDVTGGAFRGWYAYDSTSHALYSKFHVYGVRDGSRTWKVQVLSYYGEIAGAPTSAIYRVRYAEVTSGGSSAVQYVAGVDGTNGSSGECLDLGTGARTKLSPAEARASSAWHLCFRRDAISVNGELGGPRGVTAVDLDSAVATPSFDALAKMTPESEHVRFDAIDASKLADPALLYRGDRIVSAFSDSWFVPGEPRTPKSACWVVVGSDGKSRYGVVFESFPGATSASPGVVSMFVRRDGAPGG
jgi:hypothetical protein